MMNTENQFYSLEKILSYKAKYNVIIGQRSNGKTYACLEKVLRDYIKKKKQGAYIRRFTEDFTRGRASTLFENHVNNDIISELTDGEYDRVKYESRKWYLAYYDTDLDRVITDDKPFCYAFAINDMEHDKSTSYPNITNIIYDEFITRKFYLPNEFVLFANVLSTIIRLRDDVTIFMLANTVNKFCPYFSEMGLTNIQTQKRGTIDIYRYADSQLTVAVERCDYHHKERKSDVYFAFNNPQLQMITSGEWEFMMYPHLSPEDKYTKENILFSFFISFEESILQCDIITLPNKDFIYIHRKTTEIHDYEKDLIFTTTYSTQHNIRINLLTPQDKVGKKIKQYFTFQRVFYQDNEVGEIVRNYLNYTQKTLLKE